MSDATADRILEQCASFIRDPESCYMIDLFAERLEEYGKFSQEEQEELNRRHKEIILEKVIPAYEKLMAGLQALKGSGVSSRGLSHFPGGKEYYEYLLKSQTGSYVPVEQLQKRLLAQLEEDMNTIRLMLKEQPSLLRKLTAGVDLPDFSPEKALSVLQQKIAGDFSGPGRNRFPGPLCPRIYGGLPEPGFLSHAAAGHRKPQCDLHQPFRPESQSGTFYHSRP